MTTGARLIVGAFVTNADYLQALRLRRELTAILNLDVLKRYDALITASTLTHAPRFTDLSQMVPTTWPIQLIPFNLTGNPAMSVPTGLASGGLPLSMQIVGRPFEDAMVLRIGRAHENAAKLVGNRPAIARTL